MTERRGNFGKGNKNEIAVEHARMRDLEFSGFDGSVIVQKNIEVDKTRAFCEGFFAAHSRFRFPESAQQCQGREIGFCDEDRVQEPGLLKIIDRFRFVEARNPQHPDRSIL